MIRRKNSWPFFHSLCIIHRLKQVRVVSNGQEEDWHIWKRGSYFIFQMRRNNNYAVGKPRKVLKEINRRFIFEFIEERFKDLHCFPVFHHVNDYFITDSFCPQHKEKFLYQYSRKVKQILRVSLFEFMKAADCFEDVGYEMKIVGP